MFRQLTYAIFLVVLGRDLSAESLIDPTRPQVDSLPIEETGKPLPRVSAIMIGRNARHAVLDGVAVKVGGTIAGFEVATIEPGRVTLVRNGSVIALQLHPSVKKAQHPVRSP